jgi:deazaflavin-dependent oxidoreductase (nitroreductase family)
VTARNEWNRRVIEEFRANHGKVGGTFGNMPLLLLHHRGAKSGVDRINPLAYRRVGDSVAVFASAGGQPSNPHWYYNLVANPDVTVELGNDRYSARARVARGEERERIWRDVTSVLPVFAQYQEKSGRRIPVVVLDPM